MLCLLSPTKTLRDGVASLIRGSAPSLTECTDVLLDRCKGLSKSDIK